MTGKKLRQKYLRFFEDQGHSVIPSASLIPENDPTVLFTTAGMHPLVPYLLGQKHPGGKRLVNVQKSIRTNDIDEVGDGWHLTFFEMLGNWSLGDYWKNQAIEWSYEFLTKDLKIPIAKLAISCFSGEEKNNIAKDTESAEIWKSLGLAESRITYLGREDNWWGPAGKTGPCGPDTEMFYWSGKDKPPEKFDPKDQNWVEIWNDVFMQYNKNEKGQYQPLEQKNVDTGMGLERTVAVLNGLASVYETDLFKPIIKKIKDLAKSENEKSIRIIADHIRTAAFILGDEKGIEPSNLDQGYVLRRLIRRAVRHGKMIGINEIFSFKIAEVVIKKYSDVYPELKDNKDFIIDQLIKEEKKFNQTLEKGLRQFEKMSPDGISGAEAFILFSTYGFPFEMTQELAAEKGIKINEAEFKKEFAKHQEISRAGAQQKFAGGLADHSVETTRLHTANHLTLESLRRVLGQHVQQKGSNITPDRLRFDFSHDKKMTAEEIKTVEDLVNQQIQAGLPVSWDEMTVAQAKKQNAIGVFEHKYADKVKVYSMGGFSKEICGGPHVKNTSELGHFKIKKEQASSSGVRRIKAVLE